MSSIALGLFDAEHLNFEGEFGSAGLSCSEDCVLISLTPQVMGPNHAGTGGYLKLKASLILEMAAALHTAATSDEVPSGLAMNGRSDLS